MYITMSTNVYIYISICVYIYIYVYRGLRSFTSTLKGCLGSATFLAGSCWDELHSVVAFIACLFITSLVPMILPVTFGKELIEDGDTVPWSRKHS